MDAAQWPQQGIGVAKEVESSQRLQLQAEKRVRPYKEQALNCPRCNSTNTKFCYYNNYSLSQPRYFCKTCRRYWTEGGSLRNVPVGGGSRKNKRPSSASSSSSFPSSSSPSSSTTASLPASSSLNLQPSDQLIPAPPIPLPSSKFYNHGGQDLNLSFSNQSLAQYELGAASGGSISALELLRSGITARGFCLSPEPGSSFGAGFGFQELMRQSNVKLPFGHHGGYSGSMQQVQEGGTGRLLFPFEDLRQVQMSNGGQAVDQNQAVQEGDPTMFWNGGSGAGGTWT